MRGAYLLALLLPAVAQAQAVDKDLALGKQMAAEVPGRMARIANRPVASVFIQPVLCASKIPAMMKLDATRSQPG